MDLCDETAGGVACSGRLFERSEDPVAWIDTYMGILNQHYCNNTLLAYACAMVQSEEETQRVQFMAAGVRGDSTSLPSPSSVFRFSRIPSAA